LCRHENRIDPKFSTEEFGGHFMTNLERLNLELSNKPYFSTTEYAIFLDENGLTATDNYDATKKKLS
jgi:hypothetical protein